MKIKAWEDKNYERTKERLLADGLTHYVENSVRPWTCEIDGP